jgi:hypothetical protein
LKYFPRLQAFGAEWLLQLSWALVLQVWNDLLASLQFPLGLAGFMLGSRGSVPIVNTDSMNTVRTLSLALVVTLLAASSSALACGGGGSGSYRKPVRPGEDQHSPSAPSSEQGSTAPQNAPQ